MPGVYYSWARRWSCAPTPDYVSAELDYRRSKLRYAPCPRHQPAMVGELDRGSLNNGMIARRSNDAVFTRLGCWLRRMCGSELVLGAGPVVSSVVEVRRLPSGR